MESSIILLVKFVSRAVFKIWQGESIEDQLSSALYDNLGDLIDSSYSYMEKRKVNNYIESLELSIEEKINPIFERLNISEGESYIITNALAETLHAANLNQSKLASFDYDYIKLENYLTSYKGPNFDQIQTNEGIKIYYVVLSISCIYICDYVSKLSSFNLSSFREILTRVTDLSEALKVSSDKIDIIYAAVSGESNKKSYREFDKKYRDLIYTKFNKIELHGVSLDEGSRYQNLNIAYISIRAKKSTDSEDEDLPVERFLSKNKRVLLRGLAGSGKTTILQWISVNSALSNFNNGHFLEYNSLTPFIIRLRQFHNKDLPIISEFVKAISSLLIDSEPENWVEDKLSSGTAIILIDGLDELPVNRRRLVKEWINDLITLYPDCRYVLTSRPTAARADWLREQGFVSADLQEMNGDQMERFIEHWHRAVNIKNGGNLAEDSVDDLCMSLKRKIYENPSLYSLANTPLLCGMICALHKDRKEKLPEEKSALYQACIDMMLIRRNDERNIVDDGYPDISHVLREHVLREIAYWFQRNNHSSAPKEYVEEKINKILHSTSCNYTGKDVLSLLLDRCGLIREPVIGEIDFTHKTFQEFLCAQAVNNENDTSYLVSVCHHDYWHETVKMFASIAPASKLPLLVEQMINRGDKEKKYSKKIFLIAIACLGESLFSIPGKIEKKLLSRIKDIIPPNNLRDATDLASGKLLAIEAMGDLNTYKYKQAKACVRTLAKIYNDEYKRNNVVAEKSIEKLKTLKNEKRRTVIKQIYKEWNHSVDLHGFYEKVMKEYSSQIKNVQIRRREQLAYIGDFTNTVDLNILVDFDAKSVLPISELKSLNQLKCIYSDQAFQQFCDCEFSSLKSLSVEDIPNSSVFLGAEMFPVLRFLGAQSKGEFLLSDLVSVQHINSLILAANSFDINYEMSSLQWLTIIRAQEIKYSVKCNSVRHLRLAWCSVQSIDFVRMFPNVEDLTIYGGNGDCIDISAISNLNKLKSVSIYLGTDVVTLDPLLYCRNLKNVNIPSQGISKYNDWLDFKDKRIYEIDDFNESHFQADQWVRSSKYHEIEDESVLQSCDYDLAFEEWDDLLIEY